MIFLAMLGLAVVLMLPLARVFFSTPKAARPRREAALALHRAQLRELARDQAEGRIMGTEYQAAKLEIERRLLAADALREPGYGGNASLLLLATLIAVPVMAFALYLPGSTPGIPSEPHAQWLRAQQTEQARLAGFIAALRAHLAAADPNSVDASQGEAYLAEALAEQAGIITPEALEWFRQSLAHAPAQASWRELDEERIAQAAVSQ